MTEAQFKQIHTADQVIAVLGREWTALLERADVNCKQAWMWRKK